ncbi:MAG: hypothetical protein N7Q72_02570, partial [Spiroplasma sp. Tabriz.8]|nr:hypothetical protein [Spiroplasma sp. Tabriz.8]
FWFYLQIKIQKHFSIKCNQACGFADVFKMPLKGRKKIVYIYIYIYIYITIEMDRSILSINLKKNLISYI